MVGKLTTLFIALAVPCTAQDFEPDRRPDYATVAAFTFDSGTALDATSPSPLTPVKYGTFYPDVSPRGYASIYGSWGQFVVIPHSAAMHTSPMTESFWIKIETPSFSGYPNAMASSYFSGSDIGARTIWGNGATGVWTWQIETSGGGSVQYPLSSLSQWRNNAWNHLVFSHDGSRTRIYMNSTKVYDSAQAGNPSDGNIVNYTLGGPNSRGVVAYQFTLFDNMQWFRRALPDGEIVSLFQSGRTGQGDNQP